MTEGDEPDVYCCPVCDKPFDPKSRFFDFAVAAHEKDHDPSRNTAEKLLRQNASGVWCCILCGHSFGKAVLSARLSMYDHARQVHGSLPASASSASSSVPVATRDGRGVLSGLTAAAKRFVGKVVDD